MRYRQRGDHDRRTSPSIPPPSPKGVDEPAINRRMRTRSEPPLAAIASARHAALFHFDQRPRDEPRVAEDRDGDVVAAVLTLLANPAATPTRRPGDRRAASQSPF